MRLPQASPRAPRRDARWRGVAILASALVGACSLDSTGVEPAGSTASASTGDVASSSGSGTPSSSSSTGDGAGPSSSGGGEGGDGLGGGDGGGTTTGGGSPATGGGGTGGAGGEGGIGGDGGDGGRGGASGQGGAGGQGGDGGRGGASGQGGAGGQGGGGAIDEWFLRVYGADNHFVSDVATSADGAFLYVTGTARSQPTTFEGFGQQLTPNADDVFAAKVSIDGTDVEWFRIYGEGGDDQGKAIAVGLDDGGVERVFVVGSADGNTGAFADAFTGEPNARWTFLAELDPGDGDVLGGTFWPDGNLADAADVALNVRGVVAVGTVTNNFTDTAGTVSSGDDVILALYEFTDDTYETQLIRTTGTQRGVAVAASADSRGFVLVAEIDGNNAYDGDLPGNAGGTCLPLNSTGSDDVVLGFYDFIGNDMAYKCSATRAFGSANNDHAEAVATDGINAYVALRAEANIFGGMPGSWVVQATSLSQGWTTRLRPNTGNTNLTAISLGTGVLGVAGREADEGFIQSLDVLLGTAGPFRAFDGGTSPARTVLALDKAWIVGGRYTATPDFGGMIGQPPVADGGDGWLAQMAAPQ